MRNDFDDDSCEYCGGIDGHHHDCPLSELDAAKKDAERLDWLEDALTVGAGPAFVPAEYDGHYVVAPSGFQIGAVGGSSLREAIDAAKAAASSSPVNRRKPAMNEQKTIAEQFAALGWDIKSIEDAVAELDRLSSGWRTEAVRRISAENQRESMLIALSPIRHLLAEVDRAAGSPEGSEE